MALLVLYTKAVLPPSAIVGAVLALKFEVTRDNEAVPFLQSMPTRLAVFGSVTSVLFTCPGVLPLSVYCLLTSKNIRWSVTQTPDSPSKSVIEFE